MPRLVTVERAVAPLNPARLERYLWDAANILRGPVDAADFKSYIFPLLFFKRVSDVYDEERTAALAESDGDEAYARGEEQHRFRLPPRRHWEDVRATPAHVGQALQHAMHSIGLANPDTLYGIFGDAQWANKERLSDELLHNLLEHFSQLTLSNTAVQADALGQAYEYLIKKFADLTNKKAGEFYTPRSIVRLMISILDPREGETIYDPACGTGGMLLEAIHHVRKRGGNPRTLYGKLFGQERNLTTSAIARMNLFLHGWEDFEIVREDTLRRPAFFDHGRLRTFDCVIANPPFSLEHWGEEEWQPDPYGRNFAGLPPRGRGDYAWVQHMLTSMRLATGRMAVVLPHGALFRMGVEGQIRQRILERDLLEAVIGLGPNLFYGTGLAACILVFRQRKHPDRQGRVLIVDASRLYRKGRNQNTLEPEHAARILDGYTAFADAPGLARLVGLEEIAAQEWNLNIARYVTPPEVVSSLTAAEALASLQETLAAAVAAEDRLLALLREAGLAEGATDGQAGGGGE